MTQQFIYLWMMAFIRAGGLMALLPVFSGRNVPVLIRLAIAGFLGFSCAGLVRVSVVIPTDVIGLIFAAAHEMLIGLLMGVAVRLIFFAIEMAGQIISTEIGLMATAQVDPI